MKTTYLLVAAPFLIGAGPTVDVETRKDLRCLVAASSIAQSDDKTVAMAGLIASQYYLGRIDGRVPQIDLEGALVAEVASLNQTEVPGLLQTCGKLMEERGRALTTIGERIEKRSAHSSSSSS